MFDATERDMKSVQSTIHLRSYYVLRTNASFPTGSGVQMAMAHLISPLPKSRHRDGASRSQATPGEDHGLARRLHLSCLSCRLSAHVQAPNPSKPRSDKSFASGGPSSLAAVAAVAAVAAGSFQTNVSFLRHTNHRLVAMRPASGLLQPQPQLPLLLHDLQL